MPSPFERVRADFFSFQSRYEYRATLGHGATGVVFAAFDRTLHSDIAIKVLALGVDVAEEEALARFKREVALNRKVKHPNVARLHEFGVAGDLPYITMELVAGRSLWALLTEQGRLPAGRAVPVLRQVALGTHAAHELGIVHRDLKPHNVMVDDAGAVAILDFGLARDARRPGRQITRAGDIVGTPHYLAPEQVVDQVSDARSDIWAIGVVAFRTLTGEHPFDGPNPLALCQAIVDAPVPEAALVSAEVPADVAAIVLRCLQKRPEARYQRADELATDLGLADAGPAPAPAEAPLPAGPEEPPRVLLVDDDPDMRKLLRIHLEKSGCRILESCDGLDALERLQSETVDVVLMDVAMPRMDGFDATRILKAQPRFARLPVLMMSIFSDRSRLTFAIQSGATAFISKHDSLALLVEKTWELARRRRPAG